MALVHGAGVMLMAKRLRCKGEKMSHLSKFAAILSLAFAVAVIAPQTQAQVNPTAESVSEDALFEALGTDGVVSGRVSIPDRSAGNLIKPENKAWASLHSNTIVTLSVIAVFGTVLALLAFYVLRGKIRVDAGLSGRTIRRFNVIERFAHWTLAFTFIVLALSGLNLIIGKSVILPLLGEGAFGTLSAWGKIAHNYLAWPFMVSLALILVLWVVHNIPNKLDVEWLKQGGGLLKKGVHPPAKKFNAGQKVIFLVGDCRWCGAVLYGVHAAVPVNCRVVHRLAVLPIDSRACRCWAVGYRDRSYLHRLCRYGRRVRCHGLWRGG